MVVAEGGGGRAGSGGGSGGRAGSGGGSGGMAGGGGGSGGGLVVCGDDDDSGCVVVIGEGGDS